MCQQIEMHLRSSDPQQLTGEAPVFVSVGGACEDELRLPWVGGPLSLMIQD